MKNKLTKSQLKKYRKKLKTSDVLERNLLNAFRKVFSFKKKDLITINELAEQAQSFNYKGIAGYIQRIAQDIVNRNNKGFVDVVKSLITGSKGMDSTRQQELNKALQDTIKQRKIYVPLMCKFEENVSLIKNIPMDVIQELRNKYAAGVSFRGTDIEQYLTKRLGNRARLIIRTESSKLNAALTEVRARNLGISAFIWSTSEDRRVRPSHKMMDGVVVFYGNILSLDKMIGYAGEYPNCRCISAPIVTLGDIKFPVKVAVGDLYIETRKNKAVIVSGQIRTFTKQQFIQQYGKYFPNEL